MDLILLVVFSFAIYRMAADHNITPWKWIVRYVAVSFVSIVGLVFVLGGIYGFNTLKDMVAMEKIMMPLAPFVWLFQFILFYFFRTRIIRYVHDLDQIDNNKNNFPDTPGKDQKDFSYFR